MYTVDTSIFDSFTSAINYAKKVACDVYLTKDPERGPVWTASKVSAKKRRQYLDQLSAYKAQERSK